MPLLKVLSPWLSAVRRRAEPGCEIDEELRFHLEMRARDNVDAGMTPNDAWRDAVERFGDLELIKAGCQKIKREKARGLKALKLMLWVIAVAGLALRLTGADPAVGAVGNVLLMNAILLRLLLHVRAVRPGTYASGHLRQGGGNKIVC